MPKIAADPPRATTSGSPADAVRLDAVATGTRLRIRATPGARRDAILGVHDGALRVAVRAVAEKGRANEALTRLIASVLRVRSADVALVAGAGSRDKAVTVAGLSPERVRERLERALSDPSVSG